jgi:hypothetical protein
LPDPGGYSHTHRLRCWQAYNPPNATPLLVSKVSEEDFVRMSGSLDKRQTLQVKQVYRLAGASMDKLGVSGLQGRGH